MLFGKKNQIIKRIKKKKKLGHYFALSIRGSKPCDA